MVSIFRWVSVVILISSLLWPHPGHGQVEQTSLRISMDFQEADIEDVLKVLSQQAGLNFIISPDVRKRKVTVFLQDVSVRDALDAIMEAAGLAYEWIEEDCVIRER